MTQMAQTRGITDMMIVIVMQMGVGWVLCGWQWSRTPVAVQGKEGRQVVVLRMV
jgi:hypothetical protein